VIETAVALVFAHVLADFVLQSDAMVAAKRRPPVLLGHGGIVAATAWAALGFPVGPVAPWMVAPSPMAPWLTALGPVALVAASHLVIDAAKQHFGGPGFRAFAFDQAGHLAMIVLAAALFPGAFAAGLWARPEAAGADLPALMLVAAGLVAAVWAGSHAVGGLMQGLPDPPDPATDPSLPQGGRLIGKLERLMIFVLVLSGEIVGIGLLIAAKSILRFGEIQGSESRQVAEYVIIGTLASFAWALGVALATVWALGLLAG
jgi:hypothetical protein